MIEKGDNDTIVKISYVISEVRTIIQQKLYCGKRTLSLRITTLVLHRFHDSSKVNALCCIQEQCSANTSKFKQTLANAGKCKQTQSNASKRVLVFTCVCLHLIVFACICTPKNAYTCPCMHTHALTHPQMPTHAHTRPHTPEPSSKNFFTTFYGFVDNIL